MASVGKIIVAIGVLLVVLGLGLWFFADKFSWFGYLPGDIRGERPGFRFYAPLTSMLIISLVLSIILSVLARLFK
ncbi:MAG: DUF2905 domain-containing protein [Anaerolineae bacterium]|nr:DUF2905 domain-containing protein [Anaerolineae bacterium]